MERTLKILVVDDEQIVLDSVNKHLRKDNYEIIGVLSAREGLEKIESENIDIVLTDLMMPHTDGLELMKIIKEKRPGLPVIMITGYATINTALQATQLGAFDYIAKPFSKAELLGVIKRAAELVLSGNSIDANNQVDTRKSSDSKSFKTIGDQSWIVIEDDGKVLMGVERSFLHAIGRIQTVFLPSKGDKLRQGSVYFQAFSSDMRAHTVISPLSGTVAEVNDKVVDGPDILLEDPYGKGWLIKLEPSNFDYEMKVLNT